MWKRRFFHFLQVLIVLYLGICAVMYAIQRKLLFFPTPPNPTMASSTIDFKVEKETLRIATRPRDGKQAVIYFGGNGEDVSRSLNEYAASFPDHAIYMVHYRGYGGSTGKPSEAALRSDAENFYQWVAQKHSQVTIVGRSLGTGIAIRLGAEHPLERLVLITPYDSILNIAQQQYPWLPVRWLLADPFESWKDAANVKSPTVVIIAGQDEVIPLKNTENLIKYFKPGIANVVTLQQAGHNDLTQFPEFMPLVSGAATTKGMK